MPSLHRDNVFSSPQRFDWGRVDGLERLVAVPDPTADDLESYSFSPDELRDAGWDVPDDPEEAHAFAVEQFKGSGTYGEWVTDFFPVMTVLWPCALRTSPEEAANAFRREGLACTLVKGQVNGTEVSGIALRGGGMDLSDHIAAAYILCGQVPPVAVIESAIRIPSPKMERELLEAAEAAADACARVAANIRSLTEDRTHGPRP